MTAPMMVRSSIAMDGELKRRAFGKAARLGIPFTEYVRRLVAKDLAKTSEKQDISALFNLGASKEPTNIARDKHKMIGDAFWEEHLRETKRGRRRSTRKAKPE
jgi:hypothetical protein